MDGEQPVAAQRRQGQEGAASLGRQVYPWLLTGAVVGGALLRLLSLSDTALNGDEVFSRSVSVGSLPAGFEEIQRDVVHPPLYYLALRGALTLGGDSPFVLRALSVAMGIAILLLAGAWTRRVTGGWRWAFLVVLLLALSPLQLTFSQHARPYALYAFLVLGAGVLLSRALHEPDVAWGWARFSLLALAAMLTHYVSAIYLACMLPAVLASRNAGKALRGWVLSLGVPAAVLLGWLASVWPHYRAKGGLGINLDWVDVPGAYQLAAAYAEYTGLATFRRGTLVALLVTVAVVVAGLVSLRSGRAAAGRGGTEERRIARSDWTLLAVLALVPPAALFALAQPPLSLPVWGVRQAFPSHAFWLMALVLLLREVARTHRRLAVAAAVAMGVLQVLALRSALAEPRGVPYDEVANYLRQRNPPGEAMLTTSPHNIGLPVNYYLGASAAVDSFASVRESPAAFWLLYRPVAVEEQARFDSLVGRGWRVGRRAHFGGGWGTTVVYFARP